MTHQIKKTSWIWRGKKNKGTGLLCCFGVAQHRVEAIDSGGVSLGGQLLILERPWGVKPGHYRLGVPGI